MLSMKLWEVEAFVYKEGETWYLDDKDVLGAYFGRYYTSEEKQDLEVELRMNPPTSERRGESVHYEWRQVMLGFIEPCRTVRPDERFLEFILDDVIFDARLTLEQGSWHARNRAFSFTDEGWNDVIRAILRKPEVVLQLGG